MKLKFSGDEYVNSIVVEINDDALKNISYFKAIIDGNFKEKNEVFDVEMNYNNFMRLLYFYNKKDTTDDIIELVNYCEYIGAYDFITTAKFIDKYFIKIWNTTNIIEIIAKSKNKDKLKKYFNVNDELNELISIHFLNDLIYDHSGLTNHGGKYTKLMFLTLKREEEKAIQLIDYMIDNKVDYNYNILSLDWRLYNSVLHLAIINRLEDLCMKLLDQNININLTNHSGKTAFHLAISCKLEKLMHKFLLFDNLNYNTVDYHGYTPLHSAIECKLIDLSLILIDKVSDINKKTHNGYTYLHLASISKLDEVKNMLILKNANQMIKMPIFSHY